MTETKKPYISPSQIGSYTRCGEAYRRRYIKGERIPPGVALIRGSAVHKGAEFNFKQKVESHQDLKVSDVVDYAVANFDDRVRTEGVFVTPGDEKPEQELIGKAKDETVKLTELLMTDVAPRTQPKAVEERQKIEVPASTHDLLGIIDLIDENDFIVDHKTSAKTKTQDEVNKDSQFTFYALTYRAKFGKDPAGVRIENLVLKKKPEVVSLVTSRDENDYQVLVNRINSVVDAINKGVYTPASEGSWFCSPRFCGYWFSCPYVKNKRG